MTRRVGRLPGVRLLAAALALAGCTQQPGAEPSSAIAADTTAGAGAPAAPVQAADQSAEATALPAIDLVDPAIPPAVAGLDGWDYQQSAVVDLDGDGDPERAVLTARVEMVRGRPAWDDGQPWQVYIEAADSARTYLYAQRLQLGTLEMRIGVAPDGPTVVLLEHLPGRLSVYEATYRGPGDASVAVGFQRELDATGELASPRLP